MTQLWMLAQISLPWLPFTVLGQWCLRHDSFAGSYSRERLLACWSISVPIAVFLLAPSSMNLAIAAAGAWSVSAAIGAERIANAIFKELPLLETRHNRAVLQNFLGGCAAVLTLSIVWNDLGSESRPVDQALLAEARAVAADGHPLLVDLSLGEQAAVLLVELDGLATPLSSQHNSDVPANSVVISSWVLQQSELPRGNAVPIVGSSSEGRLVLVRPEPAPGSDTTRIASETAVPRY